MATVSIRCDSVDKQAAAAVAEYYGLDLSSVTRAFWKEMARTRSIPLSFGKFDEPISPVAAGNAEGTADKATILNNLKTVCERYPQIERAWLFGSVARDEIRTDSDIDVMLEIRDGLPFSLFDLGHFAREVENLSSRECDVVTSRKLRDAAFASAVERDKELAYERQEH